ncbi:MAG: ABC transporter substrate-binding protein [Ruminiclostridium sp.]|nr:ABC transporter substrate-binding protein [Ruminiclostridium sp.]
MKSFKAITAIVLTILMVTTLFSACGNKTARQVNVKAVGSAGFPLKVTDAGGTEMTIEKEPKKIVSLTLGTDEMLAGMIDLSRIASVTPFALDKSVSNVADEVKNVPNVFLSKDAEKIITLQPDLMFVDSWADSNFIKQMRDAGIVVYVFKTPSSIDEQKETVLEIAHVVGADSKGKELVAWMDEKLKTVEDKLKNLKEEDKLIMLDYSETGTTSGIGTNTDDIFKRAGVINAAAKAGLEGWPQINKESVVEWNPDLIMLPSWYYDKNVTLEGLKDMLKNDKSLASVKAIVNGKFITIPFQHMSSISQYVVLAVEDLAKAVYPDLFK